MTLRLSVDTPCGPFWTGSVSKTTGYPQTTMRKGMRKSPYVWLYEDKNGPLPIGYEIDHICTNPLCLNTDHLQAVTFEENQRLRSERRTHCARGHEFTKENTYYYKSRYKKTCRECHRLASLEATARRKRCGV